MAAQTIAREEDLESLRFAILRSAHASLTQFNRLATLDPFEALVELKFTDLGHHPIENRRLNFIEQINQTFTYLASFAAVDYVVKRHPDALPIRLNLGTAAGCDLESQTAGVAAEVFAAVRPENNRKLQKDMAKVAAAAAAYRYVFYFCPEIVGVPHSVERFPGVTVVPLTKEQVLGTWRSGI